MEKIGGDDRKIGFLGPGFGQTLPEIGAAANPHRRAVGTSNPGPNAA
jgi:hypothetical protein